ncbi:hypothetical protein K474DRAFT_1422987 [Panus rudis PR-1116 ss-1]|nr:hypothetical protein K474DRAFT_1422987 [Panus rudis PR-1116 ss-1]
MKFVAPLALLCAAAGAAEASSLRHNAGISRISSHHGHARAIADVSKRADGTSSKKRRCKSKSKSAAPSSTEAPAPSATEAPAPPPSPAAQPPKIHEAAAKPASNGDNDKKGQEKTPAPVSGLIRVNDSACGSSGASPDISATGGPNGRIDWLNCGIDAGGWNPPPVTVNDIVFKDLRQSLQEPGNPFEACKPFIDLFEQHANEHGIPSIMIASIAMQESSCNPDTVGGAGEQGLMQITPDKCGGAPGNNCKEPSFNIATGVDFFAQTLKNNNGNVLKTVGHYNGWADKMTIAQATAQVHKCCACQNNLDYLQQYFNGWLQGIDPYTRKLGKYFNLAPCHQQ